MPFLDLPLELRTMIYDACDDWPAGSMWFSLEEDFTWCPELSLRNVSHQTREDMQERLSRRDNTLRLNFVERWHEEFSHTPAFRTRTKVLMNGILQSVRRYDVCLDVARGWLSEPNMTLLWEVVKSLSKRKDLLSLKVTVVVDWGCYNWGGDGWEGYDCVVSVLEPFACLIRNVPNAEIVCWSSQCRCHPELEAKDEALLHHIEVERLMRSSAEDES